MTNIFNFLSSNSYPGRGILIGTFDDYSIVAYFIMGRSVNSRNRIFIEDGTGIKTQAFDASLMTDPSLIIYSPVRVYNGATIVTNGDQTDTIYEYLSRNNSFEAALRTRDFEPDEPNYTPRISGILEPDGTYKLSIIKPGEGVSDSCRRFFFEYPPIPGLGHFISTYKHDGNPLPAFEGEPLSFTLGGDYADFTRSLWDCLDADNKVSLFVRKITSDGSNYESIIYNKHKGD